MKIEIDARLVRAAALCQAGKKDPREYMQGIFIGANGEIVGTSSHVLFKASYTGGDQPAVSRDYILPIPTPPVSVKKVTFDFSEEYKRGTRVVHHAGAFTVSFDDKKTFHVDEIEGTYVDYKRVVLRRKDETVYNDGFSLNSDYLVLAGKVFGKQQHVVVKHTHAKSSLFLTAERGFFYDCDALMIIQPMISATDFEELTLA